MKINNNFMLREIAGCFVVVPVGESTMTYNGMFSINDTGVFLWKALQDDMNEEQLVTALLEEYEVDEQTAHSDVKEFLTFLSKINALNKN